MKKSQRQIISASRRTDIPAFYAEWFMNRIRAGYCYVPNPMYPAQKTKPVSLRAQDVDIIVFWTRNPAPLIKYLPELDKLGYKYYFQYTIIGYPKDIDPKSPDVDTAIATFKKLSQQIGREKVVWRYDPILFSNITSQEWHINQLTNISGELAGFTDRLVISFIDKYRKTTLRMRKETADDFQLSPDAFDAAAYSQLSQWIGLAMNKIGLKVFTCAELLDLKRFGIEHGKCIDDDLINKILKRHVSDKKDPAQREACGCVKSRDIGVNNTCLFGCKYCYATSSIELAEKNYRNHNVRLAALIGCYQHDVVFPNNQNQKELF